MEMEKGGSRKGQVDTNCSDIVVLLHCFIPPYETTLFQFSFLIQGEKLPNNE